MENYKQVYISIQNISDVYNLVREASYVEGDIFINRGRFSVDAKSLLGVFSIDITQPSLICYPNDAEGFDLFIQQFVVNQ